jgi:hypothetical protein
MGADQSWRIVFVRLQSCFYCSRRLRFPKVEDRREVGCFAAVSLGKAVVEHKAQAHSEGFLHTSLLLSTAMRDAPMYFRKGSVRHLANEMYSAV